MTRSRSAAPIAPALTAERLQRHWADLNARYFRNKLPPIDIVWSARLTSSAGMFASRVGPRTPGAGPAPRCIRLSVPLLQRPAPGRLKRAEQELIGTLAHEMIHQWQFDRLKRRPNHGPDFQRKMAEMNGDGLGITVRHSLDEAVQALAKYAWHCLGCGKVYQRQRRTIKPSRHRCGTCQGRLAEHAQGALQKRKGNRQRRATAVQLNLPIWPS